MTSTDYCAIAARAVEFANSRIEKSVRIDSQKRLLQCERRSVIGQEIKFATQPE